MKRIRRVLCKKHRAKWGILSGLLGSGTALLQYIPQSWPTWLGIGLTLLAFAATGISSFVGDGDA